MHLGASSGENGLARTRISRACDNCSNLHIRCNGHLTCDRCFMSGLVCKYSRQIKKRGRRSNTSKPRQSQVSLVVASPLPSSQSESVPGEPISYREHGVSTRSISPSALQPDLVSASSQSSFDRPETQPVGLESVINGEPNASFAAGLHNSIHSTHHLPQLGLYSLSPNVSTRSDQPTNPPLCRYPCLEPLLPSLNGFMSAEDACQLLDIFFADHRNSVSNITCPYILTTVLRKKSVLHPNHPRKTSLAFLTTILWTVAQTAESGIYYLPGSRKRIVDHLYSLTLTHFHLRDIDNWHRVPGGWQLDEDDMFNVDQQQCNKARTTYSKGPNPTVDDVLTLTLRTLVISGGEFKADCIKWWNKTVSLVRLLGYNTEAGLNTTHDPSADTFETQEERRRAFWLVYILDRHLALSYNRPLCILDAECRVLTPLPEELWQSLDTTSIPHRSFGPPTTISGSGIFEYFLPLTALLGDIIELRLIHHHPRLTMCSELATFEVKHSLEECEESLKSFADSQVSTVHTFQATTSQVRASLVVAYSSYILKVLYVLLYGKWDAVTMLEDTGEWISTNNFSECASNSIAASQSLTEILRVDPELSFMPYLFGIYLFHGSFILLLFAERMPQIGPNESVEQACEVIIRAHEVSIVTLSTEFQKTFRKAFRSVLYGVRNFEVTEPDFPVIRKEVLAMYRWTMGHKGLCL